MDLIDNSLVMYLVVRESLNLPPGKLCAQAGHAVGMLYELYLDALGEVNSKSNSLVDTFNTWLVKGTTKIVLRADEKEWVKLKTLDPVIVVDAGLTVVEPGTETVMGFYPMYKEQAPKIIKRLQIL